MKRESRIRVHSIWTQEPIHGRSASRRIAVTDAGVRRGSWRLRFSVKVLSSAREMPEREIRVVVLRHPLLSGEIPPAMALINDRAGRRDHR
jgi:hypothetical protein